MHSRQLVRDLEDLMRWCEAEENAAFVPIRLKAKYRQPR